MRNVHARGKRRGVRAIRPIASMPAVSADSSGSLCRRRESVRRGGVRRGSPRNARDGTPRRARTRATRAHYARLGGLRLPVSSAQRFSSAPSATGLIEVPDVCASHVWTENGCTRSASRGITTSLCPSTSQS